MAIISIIGADKPGSSDRRLVVGENVVIIHAHLANVKGGRAGAPVWQKDTEIEYLKQYHPEYVPEWERRQIQHEKVFKTINENLSKMK